MEQELKIVTPDNYFIYGNLTTSNESKETLVVFVHGFTSNKDEHFIFNGAKLFTDRGYDTFRFNFFHFGDGARHFQDTTLEGQGEDITTVVKNFRNLYKRIVVVGHSYGGTSLLFVDSNLIDAYIFWDASYIFPHQFDKPDFNYNERLNASSMWKGVTYNLGQRFTEGLKNFPDSRVLISNITKPVLFITADSNRKAAEEYMKFANEPKKHLHIEGADHNFNNIKHEEFLLNFTYDWVSEL